MVAPVADYHYHFFNIWSKKGPSELGGLIADREWCPGTAFSLKATRHKSLKSALKTTF